jgi:transcriptional regulator with XRE-family HTH domain
MLLTEIGLQIKARRETLRITQPDLAEMAGISVNTLYKIERGQANPTIRILNKLFVVLGIDFSLQTKNT